MKNNSDKINQTRTCKIIRYDKSACNRPLYDDKHCIFHSKKIKKKKQDFNKAFWKEFKRQKKEDKCYDFSRFIFPDSISFDKKKFDKDAYFKLAQFTGEETTFRTAEFTGKVTSFNFSKFKAIVTSFGCAKFTSNVTDFSRAEFTGIETSFHMAAFKGKVISFRKAKFTCEKTSFQLAQFTGIVTCFGEAEFTGINTYFGGSEFTCNMTDFSWAKFTGNETSFVDAKFICEVTEFRTVEFKGNRTDFSWVTFTGNKTSFDGAEFTGNWTSFIGAEFTGNETAFRGAEFTGNETAFRGAKFTGDYTAFRGAKFTCEVILHRAVLKNVFDWFESLVKERKWLFLKTKKYLIKDWRFYLQPETANRHPLIKRLVNDAWYLEEFKLRHPIVYFLWNITSDCGRSMLLWAAWSLGIAIGFGLKFMQMGPQAFELSHAPTKFSFFYYSIVTFTTLGFGDITPKTLTTEILVTIEVILGYVMLGGLISILANKLARRS